MFNNKSFWWVVLFVWMGASTYWHLCKIKELCFEQVSPEVAIKKSDTPPFKIRDGGMLLLTSPGNFIFPKSGFTSPTDQVGAELDSLVRYLRGTPGKKVTITGYFSSIEKNTSTYPNLGVARAEYVKSYLTSQGADARLLITRGELVDTLFSESDSIHGGIAMSFIDPVAPTEEDLAAAEKYETVFKAMDLYFPSGSFDFIKTDENTKFFQEAKKYLSNHKDQKLLLIGHTDNTGDASHNMELSKKRAEAVKRQFVNAGIPDEQLRIDGKGQARPKEPNTTESGRKANRRVEIVIQ